MVFESCKGVVLANWMDGFWGVGMEDDDGSDFSDLPVRSVVSTFADPCRGRSVASASLCFGEMFTDGFWGVGIENVDDSDFSDFRVDSVVSTPVDPVSTPVGASRGRSVDASASLLGRSARPDPSIVDSNDCCIASGFGEMITDFRLCSIACTTLANRQTASNASTAVC